MAEKETSLHKIERLTNTQIDIRNVATSAHIHHGKCIKGDSRVLLADGKVMTAKDIYEEVMKNGEIYEDNDNHTIYVPSKKIEIFSLNKENNKIEVKPVQYAWRLKGGNTIKISLRNGFNISTTLEHKYLAYRDGLVYVQAKDLKLGDRVVCSRKINVQAKQNIKKEILEKLSEK